MAPLKRSLTLVQLIFYGVGTMVGAGIYSVIGAAAGETGSFLWISFILAGIVAFLTVLSYAELASGNEKAGAEYQFMKKAFPRWRLGSFMAGYLIALNAAATSATVSLAFAGYLNVFLPATPLLAAFALLAVCTAINIAGIGQSTFVSIILICVEVAGLLLLIWAGFSAGDIGASFRAAPNLEDWTGILAATSLIFFIYIGFEDVANLSEESRDPKKNIPRALVASVLITSFLYVMVAFAAMGLIKADDMAESAFPLTAAAANVKPWMGQALAVAALFATASTALISLVSISRLLYGMAREGAMPRFLSRTLAQRQTPWLAALALFMVACSLLPLGEVKIVASISSFGVLLVFLAVHIALIRLRFREKAPGYTGFRVPLAIGRVPLLPLLGAILTVFLLTRFDTITYLVGGGTISFGILVYFLTHKRKPSGQ